MGFSRVRGTRDQRLWRGRCLDAIVRPVVTPRALLRIVYPSFLLCHPMIPTFWHGLRLAVVLAATALVLDAQAPAITPAGDPSVAADSLYKLAIDPASAGDDVMMYLFDDAVRRVERDGSGSRTYRQVTQILKQPAVNGLAERSIGYQPDRQRFTLNWVRVVRPSGEVISDKPAYMKESDPPAAMSNPIYLTTKNVRISLAGLEIGAIVDLSYTIEDLTPYRLGDRFIEWNV